MPLKDTREITVANAAGAPGKDVADGATGPKVIAAHLKNLTGQPGVYRMIDVHGNVLYVGKARNLKNRVQSYARLGGHTNRIARMIMATAAMEFVTTTTEAEALLLEANLIKRLKPRYNVLLRDDKSFPHILITGDHAAPQIVKHRGARKRPGDYFGPFASAGAVNRTVNTLQRAFRLRNCSDAIFESRTRPCLLYQIKRCAAPCTGEISPEDYVRLVGEAKNFLRGKSDTVRRNLQDLMLEAAERQEYELAADYRDRLAALSHVQQHQGINPADVQEADVFAAHCDAGQFCIQVFFFRTGQNWGNRAYFPRADKSLDAAEVLDAFIAQFYNDKPVPRLILLSHQVASRAILREALAIRAGHRVEIATPMRGTKRELVDHAGANAREALGRKLAETASQKRLLEAVARVFGLARPPRRIEVYDNSHIQGASAVGAMIVAGPEGLIKNQYRKFNIKSADLTPGDDYAMMREVLGRRFKRLLKEHGEADATGEPPGSPDPSDPPAMPAWPDLVLIDGGRGQLSAALETLRDLGLGEPDAGEPAVVGVAKGPERDAGREHFYMPGRAPFMLEPRDPVLYFLQRLRDEAHRFAIGSHRARRKKALQQNPLDEIAGIGPTRKRALLQHFGSAKAVSRAGVQDLCSVTGISAAMAETIYDFFHERDG